MEMGFTPQRDTAGLFEVQIMFHNVKRSKFEPKTLLFKTWFVPFNLQSTRQIICFILKYILEMHLLNGTDYLKYTYFYI